ncbi:hypothetical protein ETSB_0304 [cyanobacterium endosymbiont of Epithemia turgida isolate EtSB Lake Yunoko]|nr:hypothetical protein ETSB_0304 [cyanobacterium endosymbiont of Epithemia turgida isolate EtSB Lake Yunoko]
MKKIAKIISEITLSYRKETTKNIYHDRTRSCCIHGFFVAGGDYTHKNHVWETKK